jgi:hypothetical protein
VQRNSPLRGDRLALPQRSRSKCLKEGFDHALPDLSSSSLDRGSAVFGQFEVAASKPRMGSGIAPRCAMGAIASTQFASHMGGQVLQGGCKKSSPKCPPG